MPSFRSAKGQATQIMKRLQGTHLKSVRTVENYEQALSRVTQCLNDFKWGDLRSMTTETAERYLDYRSGEVGQKTLDMERQALQAMMRYVTHQLPDNGRLPVIKSEFEQILQSRAYTPEQVAEIARHQTPPHALATEIGHNAGLRAHELLTLRPVQEQPADERPRHRAKFQGHEGVRYTVTGKGGLTREIVIRGDLAERLEKNRIETPKTISDRSVRYQQYYVVGGGKRWTDSFSKASKRALGWSNGAHGVRHSYAQTRMDDLQQHYRYETALRVVSQEMGHFRPKITEVYLR